MVDEGDLRLLTVLGKNPLGTVQDIAAATGMTSATVSNRIKNLRSSGSLISVAVQLHYPTLGLEPVVAFLEAPYNSLGKIEFFLDKHPYTRYRVRCVGYYDGIYGLFAVPTGTVRLLEEFLERLSDKYVTSYTVEHPSGRWTFSENDFTPYSYSEGEWKFDWDGWEAGIDGEAPASLSDGRKEMLRRFDGRDMRILEQLTIDSRRPGKRIAAEAGITTYHLTRRMQFYEKAGLLDGFRVIMNKDVSELVTPFMFVCRCGPEVTRLFSAAFAGLPFQTTLIPTKAGFFVQAFVPPNDLPVLGTILQRRCESVKNLWSDYRSSRRYYFWPDTFRDGAWVTNRGFMVDGVLANAPNGGGAK